MQYVATTTALFALGAYLGRNLHGAVGIIAFIAAFGALIGMQFAIRRSVGAAVALLSAIARIASWALIALIVFGIVLIFVQIPGGALIYSIAGLLIFAALVAFDFQRLRRSTDLASAPLMAASILLDILNVFLLFLQLFSRSNES